MRLYIDPGTKKSGFVIKVAGKLWNAGKEDNHAILGRICNGCTDVILERPVSYRASADVDATIVWYGRFVQRAYSLGIPVGDLTRRQVLKSLFGRVPPNGKGIPTRDSLVIQEMRKIYTAPPRYGKLADDAWQALGLAEAYERLERSDNLQSYIR